MLTQRQVIDVTTAWERQFPFKCTQPVVSS